jgi:molybdenum cofactor synthesis domain-containing protein
VHRDVTAGELSQPLLPYADAIAQVVEALQPLEPRSVAIPDCLGLVLAEDVAAEHDVPGFANSAMDGYAVRSADVADASAETPTILTVRGESAAGGDPAPAVSAGTAAKIMTGAPIPDGADAVVPWEDTDAGTDERIVSVRVPAASGRHIRPAGEDVAAGTVVAAAGTVLRAVHIGLLSMVGRTDALVHPRPRVAILSTGDELVPAGEPLGPGRVHDSNGPLLAALCTRAGGEVHETDSVPDDPDRIAAWLAWWAEAADLLVTSGGASVGEHDWMRNVLSRGGEVSMWKVAVKPGKPVMFGRYHGTPLLGLPGNPGSVFACTHAFVAPAIRRLAGRDPAPRTVDATLTAEVKGDPSRTFLCGVRLDGPRADPVPGRTSQALSNVTDADGFAIVPPGGLPEGADVRVELLES